MSSSAPWDYIAKLVCIGDSGCGKSSLTIRLCEGRFVTHHDVTIGVEFGSRVVPVGPPYSTDAATRQQQQPQQPQQTPDPNSQPSSDGPKGLPSPPIAPRDKSSPPPPPQKHMKLSLWDTAGQETYKSVTRSYFRGASGALLVFDLTRRSTFHHVTDWLNDLRQIAEPDIVVVLVGNKADLIPPEGGEEEEEEEEEEGAGEGETGAGSGSGSQTTQTQPPPPTTTGTGPGTPSKQNTSGGPPRREVSRSEAEAWARQNGILEYIETSAKSGENVERAFMRVAERIFQNIQAGKYDLNDRRSGVKSAGAAGGGGGGGSNQPVRLTTAGGQQGRGCC
ncbi:hypothetical protein VTJ49DRAFT_3480 [Mycothermus thermophilus]|uniref:Uncharacterized protein n=1 Tax=Humicola insolens TaxID=85995 RepID=A0ABR3VPB2_HUMIN